MYKILKDGKKIESEVPGIYGGYKVDKIFGTLTCKSGMRMKKENRVFFHTLEDAVKQGYRPCKNCKPIGESEFQKIKHLIPEKTLEEFYNRGKKLKKFESFVNELDPYGEEKWEQEDYYAEFEKFLDERCVKEAFRRNEYLHFNRHQDHPMNYPMTFVWVMSKEGHDFWFNIMREWRNKLLKELKFNRNEWKHIR